MDAASETATFRKLATSDYEDALALYRELAGDIPVANGGLGKERFNNILALQGTSIYGAEVDGKIVSIATLHILPNLTFGGRPYCLVENVVTLRSHQGKGLGRRVMNTLIQAAWSADAYKIMLLTGKSLGARGFYEKLGFTENEKYGMMLRRAPPRKPHN
jgi:GNAT superfamily N-acetyltransferase